MLWLIGLLGVAAALALGVERVLRALGVARADPAAAPRGLALLAERLRAWAERAGREE